MRLAVFDFDGTLVDSDAALLAPFDVLGVPSPPLGLPLVEACEQVGITVADYQAHYDLSAVQPFAGVEELVGGLGRWAVCSNKTRDAGLSELDRLGWSPEVKLFSDDFGFVEKSLAPVLNALGVTADDIVYVGDTAHDRACAAAVGATFAAAAWNPRVVPEAGDVVLRRPSDLLPLLYPQN
jgi:phosphoglycolate phosphatase-like HAD superfamily hydrolase